MEGLLPVSWITSEGQLRTLPPDESLNALELIPQSMASGEKIASTEILSADILEKFGLEEQAKISIIDTPRASPDLFDDREGSAGLTMISVSPIRNRSGSIIGSAVALHLLNNDFTLVDQIREVASIDTATIFFGDLRITTNVLDSQGNRAISTRVSQEVSDIVLQQGRQFIGPAFVVNEEYITRYDPLKNHLGDVTGILYVGAKQASFQRLVRNFNRQISLVAIGTVLLTIIITTPVSRAITRPLDQLKVLVAANRRVAQGDMSVRVPVRAGGEVGLLEYSFNSMLDTLQTTQDQLVQSEKLASVGQLAAGVAHELNNPLGTILLYSDILSKELDSDSPYQDDIVLIIKETKRCKGIVSALLEFARQNQVVAEPTDINVMVKEVVELQLHQHTLGARIQVVYELDPGLPEIQADRAQLHQVLVNLIDNAIDAMPEGGKLTLRSHPGPSGMVTIVVEDTGIGIPAENISKLFTPFFTTKPTGKGTGLGLAIVYGIIKLHRGQINVASEVMQGTKFTIQLPIKLQAVSRTGLASNAFVRERNDTG